MSWRGRSASISLSGARDESSGARPNAGRQEGSTEIFIAPLGMRVYTRTMVDDAPCACTTLRRVTRAVTAAYDKALEPSGLRITQFSVLRMLDRHGPMPVTQLAERVALERSSMGRNLDPLERRGLVRFEIGKVDQRERVAHLTSAGLAAIQLALPHWRETQDRVGSLVADAAIGGLADKIAGLHGQ